MSNVELDYAMLAKEARLNDDGTLDIIGGSFLRRSPAQGNVPVAVAGRIRFTQAPFETELRVEFALPGGASSSYSTVATAQETSIYGQGRRHVLFALNTRLQVSQPGQVQVRVFLDGAVVRDLFFVAQELAEL